MDRAVDLPDPGFDGLILCLNLNIFSSGEKWIKGTQAFSETLRRF